jgi:hypothetical protein
MQPKKKRKTISPTRSRVTWSIALIASNPAPRTNSVTITRSRESCVITSGTTMNGWPRKMRASERWCCASSS